MRVLHCADFHLGSRMGQAFGAFDSERLQNELLMTFSRMTDYAAKQDIRILLIAGDLFDTAPAPRMEVSAVRQIILAHPDISFYYLRGNHDAAQDFASAGELPDNLFLFDRDWTIYPLSDDIILAGRETWPLPAAMDYPAFRSTDFNLLMLHGAAADYRDLHHRNLDYAAFGHFHTHMVKKIDERGILVYPGCPVGRGFDETGPKGFVVLDINDHTHYYDYHFVDFASHHYFSYETDITGALSSEEILEKIKATPSAGETSFLRPSRNDYVRFLLKGRLSENAEKNLSYLKQALEGLYGGIEIIDQTRIDRKTLKPEMQMGIRGEFLRLVRSDPSLSPELREEILSAGLKLLKGEKI